MNFFILLLFGHLAGDYLFQSKAMALKKSSSHVKCMLHCMIYTVCISIFTFPYTSQHWLWPAFVYITHYPIDRYSLADKWLALINGRTLQGFVDDGYKDIPANSNYANLHVLSGSFAAIVYTVVDNTMHLGLMYFGYLAFFK